MVLQSFGSQQLGLLVGVVGAPVIGQPQAGLRFPRFARLPLTSPVGRGDLGAVGYWALADFALVCVVLL